MSTTQTITAITTLIGAEPTRRQENIYIPSFQQTKQQAGHFVTRRPQINCGREAVVNAHVQEEASEDGDPEAPEQDPIPEQQHPQHFS